jgi:hypothetical protein
MEIVIYRGRRIMGFRASCRAPRCNWTATYGNEAARVKGIRQHRKEAIHTDRYNRAHLACLGDEERVDRKMRQQADIYTTEYNDWVDIVEGLLRDEYGVGLVEMDIDPGLLRVSYGQRMDAWAAVAHLTNTTLEIVR